MRRILNVEERYDLEPGDLDTLDRILAALETTVVIVDGVPNLRTGKLQYLPDPPHRIPIDVVDVLRKCALLALNMQFIGLGHFTPVELDLIRTSVDWLDEHGEHT